MDIDRFDKAKMVERVKTQMDKKGIKPTELARIIGMSQPAISRKMNIEKEEQFTLEQVYDMANYFGVTMDELVGRPNNYDIDNKTVPCRKLCEWITELIEYGAIKVIEHSADEYERIATDYPEEYSARTPGKKEVTYKAFYFTNYYDNDEDEYPELYQHIEGLIAQYGNVLEDNEQVNNYFDLLMETRNKLIAGKLTSNLYEEFRDFLLSKLPERMEKSFIL